MAENVEDYMREYSVLDRNGDMDGEYVPWSIALFAIEGAINGKLEYKGRNWYITPKSLLEKLVREYSEKYPAGEFMFSPMYSADERYVSGILCWDWKKEIYHVEFAHIDEVIELIKGLTK